jgi:hypothetical protein
MIWFKWWIFDHLPLGRFAPYVFGLLIGSRPNKIKNEKNARQQGGVKNG